MAYIAQSVQRRVREAANHRCGYCLTSQQISGAQMHIEHIRPVSRGGNSDEDNLWLACALCNSYKGAQTDAIDPQTTELVSLFNPRTQVWHEHFAWSDDGATIIGKTPIGRATVSALQLNNRLIMAARRQWVLAGWHPPAD